MSQFYTYTPRRKKHSRKQIRLRSRERSLASGRFMDGISISSSIITSVIHNDNYIYRLARLNVDLKFCNVFDSRTRKAAHQY